MSILHVTPVYAPAWQYGGPIRSTHALTTALVAGGNKVTVVTTNIGTPDEGARTISSQVIDGVTVVYCPARITPLGIMSSCLASTAQTASVNANIAHLTGVWQPTMIGVQRMLLKQRMPYVVSPRGALSAYSFAQSRWKKWPYYYLFERRIEHMASVLHATAPIERDELLALNLGVPVFIAANICDSAPWFYDPDAAQQWRQSHQIPANEFVIMHVGRVHPKKNLGFLIDVAASLRTDRQWRIVFVGPVAAREKPYLARLKSLLPTERLTVVSGTGENKSLRAAYSAADAVVLPSLSENFGNAVIEALLCNAPVLSSPHVGASLMTESIGGTTILPLEKSCWKKALDHRIGLAQNERVESTVRETIARLFAPQSIASQFEELYASVLSPASVAGSSSAMTR